MTNRIRSLVARPSRTVLALPLLAALWARRAQVGGQAVIEGIMMRGVDHWSLAVRRTYRR